MKPLKNISIASICSKIPSPKCGIEDYILMYDNFNGEDGSVGITIGDDVMIAPNTFVNQDVPSHSVVVGNPCKIISVQDATSKYIYYRV